jgi:hypothetical protein
MSTETWLVPQGTNAGGPVDKVLNAEGGASLSRWLAVGTMAFATGAGGTALPSFTFDTTNIQVAHIGSRAPGSSGPWQRVSPVEDGEAGGNVRPPLQIRSDRETISWIKDSSGLTWEQLGRVFGVSRRAVHMWASGSRMNQGNAAQVHEFAGAVERVQGSSVTETRTALLSVGSTGDSIVNQFRRTHRTGGSEASGSTLTPLDLIGAAEDEGAEGV